MVFYLVSKSQNTCDSDGWQWWVEECPVSYHASKEGAEAKVQLLIQEQLEHLKGDIPLNPDIPQEYWKVEAQKIADNMLHASIGDNGREREEYELFVITVLLMED